MNIKKIIAKLNKQSEEYLMAFLLVVLALVMLLQVIMRYFFKSALSWPEEFCRYVFIFISFLSIGYTVQKGLMLRLDFVTNILPKKVKRIYELFIWGICFIFFIYMLTYSFLLVKLTIVTKRVSPTIGIPYYIVYSSSIIGFGFGSVRTLQLIYNIVLEKIEK